MKVTAENANSFHDAFIHGFEICTTEMSSEVHLDIDYISGWHCYEPGAGPTKFELTPGKLIFRKATNLRVIIDWGESGFSRSVHGLYIYEMSIMEAKTSIRTPQYFEVIIKSDPGTDVLRVGTSQIEFLPAGAPRIVPRQYLTPEERMR